jgi:hypothetical protein
VSYESQNDLVEDREFQGRVRMCVAEQAEVFVNDDRPEYKQLAIQAITALDPTTAQFIPMVAYISASWSGVQIVQNQNWRPGLGGMTMPFTGDIFVDLWVQTDYIAGATYLASSVWPATPIGPTNYYAGKVSQWDNYGGTFPVPFFGRWANLAVGTYFDLTIVSFEGWAATVKAWPG